MFIRLLNLRQESHAGFVCIRLMLNSARTNEARVERVSAANMRNKRFFCIRLMSNSARTNEARVERVSAANMRNKRFCSY